MFKIKEIILSDKYRWSLPIDWCNLQRFDVQWNMSRVSRVCKPTENIYSTFFKYGE